MVSYYSSFESERTARRTYTHEGAALWATFNPIVLREHQNSLSVIVIDPENCVDTATVDPTGERPYVSLEFNDSCEENYYLNMDEGEWGSS